MTAHRLMAIGAPQSGPCIAAVRERGDRSNAPKAGVRE